MKAIKDIVTIAICIATYNRPKGLNRLLHSINELEFITTTSPDWKTIVVDNDPRMPNQTLINSFKRIFQVPIYYGKEETRGMASARNRCVEIAGDVDFIAFVDDDEIVEPSWLDELIYAQKTYNADVVVGPVHPIFETSPPNWFITGRFLERYKHLEGEELETANSGNVLIKRQWLRSIKGPFDERFNLSGGEDSLFFSQIQQLGARIIYTTNAKVEEICNSERLKAIYLIERAFRVGSNRARVEMVLKPSLKTILIRCLKGCYHLVKGMFLMLPLFILYQYTGLIKSIIFIFEGFGEILGFFGFQQNYYRNVNEI